MQYVRIRLRQHGVILLRSRDLEGSNLKNHRGFYDSRWPIFNKAFISPMASSTKSKSFPYYPLVAPGSIRLIELRPASTASQGIQCSLLHTTLADCQVNPNLKYTALSYVWGDQNNLRLISIDGVPIQVTANLHTALRDIRHCGRASKIWVDAICIDQSNTEERNHQVQQMRSIYASAAETIIYLGPSRTDNTVIVFNAARELENKQRSSFRRWPNIFTTLASHVSKTGVIDTLALVQKSNKSASKIRVRDWFLSNILDRPWFTRVWVFQELVFSQNPWVQCGIHILSWDNFMAALFDESLLTLPDLEQPGNPINQPDHSLIPGSSLNQSEDRFKLGIQMHKAHVYHQESSDEKNVTLHEVLQLRRGAGACDPRDMVFAHVGFAHDGLLGDELLFIDYQKT